MEAFALRGSGVLGRPHSAAAHYLAVPFQPLYVGLTFSPIRVPVARTPAMLRAAINSSQVRRHCAFTSSRVMPCSSATVGAIFGPPPSQILRKLVMQGQAFKRVLRCGHIGTAPCWSAISLSVPFRAVVIPRQGERLTRSYVKCGTTDRRGAARFHGAG